MQKVEFYILTKGQYRYSSWPFDEAKLLRNVISTHIPRVGESVQLKDETQRYKVVLVGYRVLKTKIVPCILLDK